MSRNRWINRWLLRKVLQNIGGFRGGGVETNKEGDYPPPTTTTRKTKE